VAVKGTLTRTYQSDEGPRSKFGTVQVTLSRDLVANGAELLERETSMSYWAAFGSKGPASALLVGEVAQIDWVEA